LVCFFNDTQEVATLSFFRQKSKQMPTGERPFMPFKKLKNINERPPLRLLLLKAEGRLGQCVPQQTMQKRGELFNSVE
jgi:hypothetical protein